MIFVSSTNVKNVKIIGSITELAKAGFKNIELSGGTNYYEGLEQDLLNIKAKYNLRLRLHNYFPPPAKPFVLNLSSENANVLKQSRDLIKKAIVLSNKLGASKYGVHAGFRISPKVSELGKNISSQQISPYAQALEVFKSEYLALSSFAKELDVDLYLENNVISEANFLKFENSNPFFLTNNDEYRSIKDSFSFPLLLDVAHLKVSCNSLGLNFKTELDLLIKESDYLHISDNLGKIDSNNKLSIDSEMYDLLRCSDLSEKTFTLEIYDGISSLTESYENLESLLVKNK